MKTLIFDWSGTLHDNFSAFCEVFYAIMNHFHIEKKISKDEIRKNIRSPYMDFWHIYLPEITFDELESLYEYYLGKTKDTKVYPGVKETIHCLSKKGDRLFVVSSDPKLKLIEEVKNAAIDNYFEEIITDIHYKDKELKKLIKTKKIDIKNCYYIGDTAGDMLSAKSAGMKTIGISWGFQDKSKLEEVNPDILIDDIIELQKL